MGVVLDPRVSAASDFSRDFNPNSATLASVDVTELCKVELELQEWTFPSPGRMHLLVFFVSLQYRPVAPQDSPHHESLYRSIAVVAVIFPDGESR